MPGNSGMAPSPALNVSVSMDDSRPGPSKVGLSIVGESEPRLRSTSVSAPGEKSAPRSRSRSSTPSASEPPEISTSSPASAPSSLNNEKSTDSATPVPLATAENNSSSGHICLPMIRTLFQSGSESLAIISRSVLASVRNPSWFSQTK